MIKKIVIFITFTFLILLPNNVMAYTDTIDEIKMDIYIDSVGTANVTETWTTEVASGTENYKPYGNLGNSSITNFSVTDEKGNVYEYLNNWDVNASKTEKDYKNGINITDSGIELCFGLGDYGNRVYTLKYKITNFVNKYNDSDGIYYSLMPDGMDPSPSKVKITITSDIMFNETNSQIWAFGYEGDINFVDGTIVMNTVNGLTANDYMVALVKINEGLFAPNTKISKDFKTIYDDAMLGTKNDEQQNGVLPIILYGAFGVFGIIMTLISFFVPIVVLIILIKTLQKHGFKAFIPVGLLKNATVYTYAGGNILPPIKDVNYWRRLPCSGDLISAYWLGYNYGIITEKSGLIGAILLKWVKLEHIDIAKTKAGLFNFKDNNYAIDLSRSFVLDNEVENALLTIMKSAAGDNSVLEAKEFENWCRINYTTVENWFARAMTFETKRLEQLGKVATTVQPMKVLGLFEYNKETITVSSEMRDEAIRLLGLKRFLLDFSIIEEREVIEVSVWEEYLIFAQLLGIADKVEEQFSKIYPDYSKISRLNTDTATIATRRFANLGYNAVQSSYRRSSGGYSGGGGGSSHSSGGGSSSGRSSGGGRR